MNFDELRHRMVADQLQRRGIHDSRVLEAMDWVPRHEFVPGDSLELAYSDCALPIACDQTISQPYTVAFMCQAARIRAGDRVLEVGTGSGYGAAVLSLLAKEVHTVERIEALHRTANALLRRLGYSKVHCHLDDGTLGLPGHAPFDAIVVAAGAEKLPEALREQLADGGRLIIPVGPSSHQRMICIIRDGDRFTQEDLGSFGFVPLVSDRA